MRSTRTPPRRSPAPWVRIVLTGLLCLAALPQADAGSRPIRFERLGLDEGLSQNTVLTVFQDSRGFIWIGTEDGLNRYDGRRFHVYQHDETDPGSLPNDQVWAIAEDRLGDLWLAIEGGGIARWVARTDRFVRYVHDPARPDSLASNLVRTLAIDPHGFIWIGTRGEGLDRLDPATGRVTHFRHDTGDPRSLPNDSVYALMVDREGRLWVGTDGGLSRRDPQGRAFVHVRYDDPTGRLAEEAIRALHEDSDGRLWIGTRDHGVWTLDPESGEYRHLRHDPADPDSLGHDRVNAITEDRSGRVWVGTAAGLDLIERDTTTVAHYRHDATSLTSLADDDVLTVYEDRGGVLWVGTRFGGVSKWNPTTWSFGHHSADRDGTGEGLTDNRVISFAGDRWRRVWIGTFGGGLHVLDRRSGGIERYVAPRGSPPMGDGRLMTLLVDHRDRLWVGSYRDGLFRLDLQSGELVAYRHDPAGPGTISAPGIMSLFEDRQRRLWIGTFGGGLNRYDAAADAFVRYPFGDGASSSLKNGRVTCFAEDAEGGLWIGTDGGGLHRLDPETGALEHFEYQTGSDAGSVMSLHVTPDGPLYVGTRGSGLVRLIRTGEPGTSTVSVRHYGQRDGLGNDAVYGIEPDSSGHLWLSTNNGLYRFDPRTDEFTRYGVDHGLQANEFNFGAHYRTPDGELFFGGIKGFNAFVPEKLARNERIAPVVLTSFLKLNQPAELEQSIFTLDALELGYEDDVVTFEFAALDYAAPEQNTYRYRLEGFDREWVDLGTVRRVTYTNLDPGRYVFRVQAANSDGVWNTDGLAVTLHVEAPPWRQWWAYTLYALAAGAVLVHILRRQQRKRRQEIQYRRRLEAEVKQRTQELAARNVELERLNSRLENASLSDPMTGVRNRRFLFEHVAKDINLVRRRFRSKLEGAYDDRPKGLVFLIVDIDHFKSINDTYGHPAGDAVIVEVVHRLTQASRDSDILIRWGGDEFLLIGRDSDGEQAARLAERIRTAIADFPISIDDRHTVRATCSIGFACFPFLAGSPDALSWEETLSIADLALYSGKRTHRNAWVGYVATATTPAADIERLLRDEPARLERLGNLEIRSSFRDRLSPAAGE